MYVILFMHEIESILSNKHTQVKQFMFMYFGIEYKVISRVDHSLSPFVMHVTYICLEQTYNNNFSEFKTKYLLFDIDHRQMNIYSTRTHWYLI